MGGGIMNRFKMFFEMFNGEISFDGTMEEFIKKQWIYSPENNKAFNLNKAVYIEQVKGRV